MQVYCSKLAAAEQRVCIRLWFLTFSRGNREGCEPCTKLRPLVPEVHTLKATVIGTLGHESADNWNNLSKCKWAYETVRRIPSCAILVLALEQEGLWKAVSTAGAMTYCLPYVRPKDALHKLMQYSDYSMDLRVCHPWLSTKPCHWSPFTFSLKIAGILASLRCWRSSSLQGEIHKGEQKMKRYGDDREKREFLKVTLGSECEAIHFLTSRQLVISVQDDSNKKSRFFQGLYSLRNAVILGQFVWHFKQEGRWRGEKTPRRKYCYIPSHLFLIHKDGDALWGERVTCLWPFSACLPTSTSKNTLLPWLLPWIKDHLAVCKSALWLLCFFFFFTSILGKSFKGQAYG